MVYVARPWESVAAKYESLNRSELDDANLMLEEPLFGELEETQRAPSATKP